MVRTFRSKHSATLLVAAIASTVFSSCGLRPQISETVAPQISGAAPQSAEAPAAADVAQNTSVPAPRPQLARTANLGIRVESIDAAIEQTQAIAKQHQGEVMSLQNQTPNSGSQHQATVQIRVPQTKLVSAIAALAQLGTVQRQSRSAEDVSTQLVDHQARLRNLRRSEETVLEILDRSSNVGDVLKVAQELNNIRQSIEQINAQLSSLQNQVAYSTIDLSLESTTAPLPARPSTPAQLTNTWRSATRSIGKFTVNLMQIGLWLLVYSPYLLLLIGAASLYRRRRRIRSRQD